MLRTSIRVAGLLCAAAILLAGCQRAQWVTVKARDTQTHEPVSLKQVTVKAYPLLPGYKGPSETVAANDDTGEAKVILASKVDYRLSIDAEGYDHPVYVYVSSLSSDIWRTARVDNSDSDLPNLPGPLQIQVHSKNKYE